MKTVEVPKTPAYWAVESKVIDPVPFRPERPERPVPIQNPGQNGDVFVPVKIPAGFRPERPGSVPGVPFRVQNKNKIQNKKEKLNPYIIY